MTEDERQKRLLSCLVSSNTALRYFAEGGSLSKNKRAELREIVANNDAAISEVS